MLDYEQATLVHDNEVYPYDHRPNAEGAGGFSDNLFVGEYSLMQQIHNLGAFLDVATVLYPQLQTIDLRKDVTRLAVPVYFAEGRYEARGRAEPFQQCGADLRQHDHPTWCRHGAHSSSGPRAANLPYPGCLPRLDSLKSTFTERK